MKVGIGSYTLTWSVGVPGYETPQEPLTARGLLLLASERGIKLVQMADNMPLHLMDDGALRELRDLAEELRIELEIGTRGTEPGHLLDYLRIADLLGARLVRTLITIADLDVAAEQLREALPKFEAAQVTLAIENHGLHTTKQLSALFDVLESPYAGCCLDTVNSFSALDSPDTVIRDLSPYVVNLHVKDFDITRVDHQMGFAILGKPAGHGKLNIPGLLTVLDSLGKKPNAILELWTPYAGTVEQTVAIERQWLDQSLAYLRTLPLLNME
ncbi:sugar phosphate isomerase/epimerase [Paenibacillus lycopersici]|uniref:Sugar phosphate isomerase/epimerase n=1 Tax=Paenibacillus lycopersici TaxID=2704462 RepID=A0A6C0G613_9BACL|nr:TIM barrel protein [Paenibacillus lycopersici]QHT63309.1 sugar phosphate isomerase/epimerase [Paenibacillus lycopersici]